MDNGLREDRLSRAARRIKGALILAALVIASNKSEIAESVLTRPAINAFTAALSHYGLGASAVLHLGGLILIWVCTYLSEKLVDLVLVRSFLFRMIVLRGRNIEGRYVAFSENEEGRHVVFSTITHDGIGYREEGRVFQKDGLLYAKFEIETTFFDDKRKRLKFIYDEERFTYVDGRVELSSTTGHGRYDFHYKPMILAGLKIPYRVLSAFEAYYTDDKAKTGVEHWGSGWRLSIIKVDPAFRAIPFSNFDDWDKQKELAKALLAVQQKSLGGTARSIR